MHSTDLRGTDFAIAIDGRDATLPDVLGDFAITRRVGVICPAPLDGLGAATLLMAAVTAFYDGYRRLGGAFFAYPDFYTLQLQAPVADYGMFDIWPAHKNVAVDQNPSTALLADAITDRGIDTLLVPEGWQGNSPLQPVQLSALQRTLRSAFVYAPGGTVAGAEISIGCAREPLMSWADKVIATVTGAGPSWFARTEADQLEQSFHRLAPADAIAHL